MVALARTMMRYLVCAIFFVLCVLLIHLPITPAPDTETQIVDDDPIQSFEGEYDQYDQRGRSPTPVPQKKAAQRSKMRQVSSQEDDDALQCLCGMNVSRTYFDKGLR